MSDLRAAQRYSQQAERLRKAAEDCAGVIAESFREIADQYEMLAAWVERRDLELLQ